MKTSVELNKALAFIAKDDCKELKKLLRLDADLAFEPRLINRAALLGKAQAVSTLLEAGADSDAQVPSHEYYRPLHRAIEHRGLQKNAGHMETVRILLDAGASLEKRAAWMQLTPLAVAGMAGDMDMIRLLIGRGANVNIFTAAITADSKKVRTFLKRKSASTGKDSNNMTVLHYAALCGLGGPEAEEGERQIAEMLLDAGADGDAREDIGPYPATPVLHFAAYKNYPLTKVLLSRGCNPNYGFGNSLWKEPGPMAELFRSHGADVNGREPSGQPLLNRSIHWNLPSVALWLLKNGANPNLIGKEGNTALHEAVWRGINPHVVQVILACGGNKTAKNHEGKTALDIAKVRKRKKILPLLR